MGLLDEHKSEISALNALVQLQGGSGGTSATLGNLDTNIETLVTEQNAGTITTGILAPVLPYTIADGLYNSFTIITTGSVSIDSITVPAGLSYTYSCNSNETLTGKALANISGGSVIILTQQKL